jgi:hypothetical protein
LWQAELKDNANKTTKRSVLSFDFKTPLPMGFEHTMKITRVSGLLEYECIYVVPINLLVGGVACA